MQARAKLQLRARLRERLASLTKRESEIMEWLLNGKSTKEMARIMGTTMPTVDKHRWKVFEKMQVETVVELANLLHEIGVWEPQKRERPLNATRFAAERRSVGRSHAPSFQKAPPAWRA